MTLSNLPPDTEPAHDSTVNNPTANIDPTTGGNNSAGVENTSPDTAVTSWSSAPVTNWPATPTSYAKREALRKISRICPKVNEDILLLALEEHDYVVDNAVDLLTGTGMDDSMTTFLVRVFPGVPRATILEEVNKCYRRYLEVFSKMVMKYHSYWKPHPDPTTSALSLSPPLQYKPDFRADGHEEEKTEAAWWKTLADTVRWQVSPQLPDNHTWETIISACHLTHKSFSPRLAAMVRDLNGPSSGKALEALKVLPAYSAMVDLASNSQYRDLCTGVVTILASNGIAAPGAVAWAFEKAIDNPAKRFVLCNAATTYYKTSSTIWVARNKAMFAHQEKSFNAPIDPILVDDEERDGFSIQEVPVSPTVSRITRTSAGSRKKKSPYPSTAPRDKKRASDDDIRAAESSVKGKRVIHEDIIELTSESDADDKDTGTVKGHNSPAAGAVVKDETVATTPKKVLMSPSIVSPKKAPRKKAEPARKSPVKAHSTRT